MSKRALCENCHTLSTYGINAYKMTHLPLVIFSSYLALLVTHSKTLLEPLFVFQPCEIPKNNFW